VAALQRLSSSEFGCTEMCFVDQVSREDLDMSLYSVEAVLAEGLTEE